VKVGIDFVGNPIIGEHESEERADEPENPAVTLPHGEVRTALHGNVHEVGGTIEDVGDDGETREGDEILQLQGWAEVWPGDGEPGNGSGGEDGVVDQTAQLPEAEGVGEVGAEWGGWEEELGLSGLRGIHTEVSRRENIVAKRVWCDNSLLSSTL